MRWTRALRALGARLARRRGGWRSSWTRWRGVGLTEGVATARGWRRWRRPWLGRARGRSWRGEGVSGRFRGERETDPWRHLARGAARRRAGAWRTPRSPSGTCLPAWPASSSLARCWAGPAGGLASGPAVAPGRVFPFFFYFLFYLIILQLC